MEHLGGTRGADPAADLELYARGVVMENLRLHAGVDELRDENARLRATVGVLHGERDELAGRLAEAEERGAEMMKLCIALTRVHGATDRAGVLEALREVVINVIGSEEFAILGGGGDDVALLDGMGAGGGPAAGEVTRRVVSTGRAFIASDGDDAGVAACVPLRCEGRVTGAIAIYRLLEHKGALEPFDHVLLDAVADAAGAALRSAELRAATA